MNEDKLEYLNHVDMSGAKFLEDFKILETGVYLIYTGCMTFRRDNHNIARCVSRESNIQEEFSSI